MKRMMLVALLTLGLGVHAFAAPKQTADSSPTDKTAPSYDMKAQALLDLDAVHQRKVVGESNTLEARLRPPLVVRGEIL